MCCWGEGLDVRRDRRLWLRVVLRMRLGRRLLLLLRSQMVQLRFELIDLGLYLAIINRVIPILRCYVICCGHGARW